MSSIDEFLRTGRLGILSAGMDRDEVRSLLGEPEATSRQKNFELWKYGSLQIGFHRDPFGGEPILTTINLYFHNPGESPPEPLGLVGWMPTDETTIEGFRRHIHDYDGHKYDGIEGVQSSMVTLDSGVRASFDEGRLYGLHYQHSRKPEGKQLTLFLPNDVLETLRKEASERSVSISNLCVRWIKERAEKHQETEVHG